MQWEMIEDKGIWQVIGNDRRYGNYCGNDKTWGMTHSGGCQTIRTDRKWGMANIL